MKSRALAMGLLLCWVTGTALAQDSASLADLARKQRENRMKVMREKSVRVYNNDNMPRRPAGEGPTAAARMSAVPVTPEAPGSLEASSAAGSGAHDEKYFRAQTTELRERLEMHKRQLAVLQQKQAQGQLQYYSDPNKTLQEEFSRSEINKKNDQVAEKEKEIAEDEKAIQDLQDLLRREGHPAGWLR